MNLPDSWKTKAKSRKENLQKNSPVINNDIDKLYEVKPIYPSEKYDGKQYSMAYDRLVPILINAVKELSAKVTALEAA